MIEVDYPLVIPNSKENRCENCKFYRIINSAYGHCTVHPPKQIPVHRIFRDPLLYIIYPDIPFDLAACGLYNGESL